MVIYDTFGYGAKLGDCGSDTVGIVWEQDSGIPARILRTSYVPRLNSVSILSLTLDTGHNRITTCTTENVQEPFGNG